MELREIKQIIELMQKNDLSHFELERDGMKIKLKKGADLEEVMKTLQAAQPAPVPAAAAIAPAAVAAAEPSAAAGPVVADQKEPEAPAIKAPMVGTFYRSPSPDDSPFVKVGDEVNEETVICIIEAMKVMNEIKAEVKGKVSRILAEDSKPVQYGDPMFEIQPA